MIRVGLAILACAAAGALAARWALMSPPRDMAAEAGRLPGPKAARPPPPPTPRPAGVPAPTPVAAPAPVPPQAAPAATPAAPAAALDSGPCFYATIARPPSGPPVVEGIGQSLEPFRRLEQGLAPAVPTITAGLVDPSQCPAVEFVARYRGRPDDGPRIAVRADVLGGNDELVGSVDGYTDRYVVLVLVDRLGHVSDLGDRLRPSVDAVSFYMPRAGAVAEGPALLVALATTGRAAHLPAARDAPAFFADLAAGLAQADAPAAAARFIRIGR